MDFIFVATDSAYQGIDWDDSKKAYARMNCVKVDAIPADELKSYTPLTLFFMIGEKDEQSRLCKGLEKIENGYRVTGILSKGRPFPFKNDFIVDETFSFPSLFDGTSNSVAKPLITDIYTDYDEIISYVQELETRMGRKLKMAEETKMAEQERYDAESYETAMEELAKEISKPSWMKKYRAEAFHSRRFDQYI